MTATTTSFIQQRDYWAVAITHFFVDVLNSSRNLLVAIIAVNIGLTNAQVGLALLLYNVGNALSQPLFGWLADRIGPRWLVVGGMGWMIGFFSVAALSGDWSALVALTIAGIGSGAFHPTGTMVASQVSPAYRGRATAVFFMSGQMGLFMGPILAGLLLEGYGRSAYLVLPMAAFLAFFSGWQWVSNKTHHARAQAAKAFPETVTVLPHRTRRGLLLVIIILATGTTGFAASNFAPKFFVETGFAEGYIGLLTGLYMGGSAIGNVIGGFLGDRIKGKWVMALAALIAVLPVYLYVPVEGNLRLLLLGMAGFFVGMPHSLLVLSVQGLFPRRRAMGSGIALGFMFFGGSIGSYGLGVIADNVGLALALQGTAVLPFLAAVAAVLLPGDE